MTRKRVLIAIAGIAVVLAIIVVVVVVDASHPTVKHDHPKAVVITQLPRFDVAVVVAGDATERAADRVQSILDDSDSVRRYSPLPARNLAYILSFAPGDPRKGLRADVCANRSTRSFAVQLSRSDTNAEQRLKDALGSDATVKPTGSRGALDTEIFMRVHATAATVAAVRQQLAQDPDITSVEFLSHDDAYAEFKKLFADQPELVRNEAPEGLPESFRITVREGARLDDVAQRYERAPGVDQVNSPEQYPPLPPVTVTFDDICSSDVGFGLFP